MRHFTVYNYSMLINVIYTRQALWTHSPNRVRGPRMKSSKSLLWNYSGK